MGRKSNTALRRQQIIEALLHEMSSVGYERASTKSIAQRAKLAPGLVHYHFKSKEEILLGLVDGLIMDADQRMAAALQAGGPRDKLLAYATSRVGLGRAADTQKVRAWLSIHAEAMGQPKVRKRLSRWLSQDHAQLARLFAEAGRPRPREDAATLLAMILGGFTLYSIRVSGVPDGYAERQVHDWIRSLTT